MIEEYGVVRETTESVVSVEITVPGECEKCEAHDACRRNGGIVRAAIPSTAAASEPLSVGQQVRLRVRGTSLLGATAVVYGIPLLGLFVGLIVGYLLFLPKGEDLAAGLAALCGAVALVLSGFLVKALDTRLSSRLSYDVEPTSLYLDSESGANSR